MLWPLGVRATRSPGSTGDSIRRNLKLASGCFGRARGGSGGDGLRSESGTYVGELADNTAAVVLAGDSRPLDATDALSSVAAALLASWTSSGSSDTRQPRVGVLCRDSVEDLRCLRRRARTFPGLPCGANASGREYTPCPSVNMNTGAKTVEYTIIPSECGGVTGDVEAERGFAAEFLGTGCVFPAGGEGGSGG